MKRRLPNTDQGGFVVVHNNVPPHTNPAKGHRPGQAGPWRAVAAAHANPTAVSAAAGAVPGHRHGSRRPSSTDNDANPASHNPARETNRRTQSLAVVCGTSAFSAAGRTPHLPSATASITAPIASTPSRRPTSTKLGNNACDTEHGPHLPRRIQTR
jgi:hypothetical protein